MERTSCIDDHLDECIAKARDLLQDPATPRYHRMETLVLLDSTSGEWQEADECCAMADALWRVTRRWKPGGQTADVDDAPSELRAEIDGLRQALEEDRPILDEEDPPIDDEDDPETTVATVSWSTTPKSRRRRRTYTRTTRRPCPPPKTNSSTLPKSVFVILTCASLTHSRASNIPDLG